MVKKFRMNFTIFVNFIIIGSLLSIHANSQETYFDLSQDEIQIRTNFDGKEIIIFGLLEDDHDTILAIRGPSKKLKIQKKERYFGVWFNSKRVTYSNVPNIFLASTNDINSILPESKLIQEDLSFDGILKIKIIIKILFLKMTKINGYKVL